MKPKKLIFKLISILILTLFVFTACKNDTEEIIIEDTPNAVTGMKVINYGYYGKDGKSTSGTSIAVFDSQGTYDNTVANLETQVEAWDDQFVTQWGHLDDDALDAKEEELNFDAEKPLTDFENQVGLNSLRKKYLAEEEAWLNNEELNPLTDPDNKFEYEFDDNEKAVLNRYSEVQIGTKIIKELNEDEIQDINQAMQKSSKFKNAMLVEDGATLVIEEEDYNSLIDFNEGDMSIIENDNVTVQQTSSDCKSRKSKKVYRQYDNGSKRVRLKVKLRSFVSLSTRSKAKIDSFKKKGSRWKRHRTKLGVGVQNYSFCEGYAAGWSGYKRKNKRRKLKKNMVTWNTGQVVKAQNGQSVLGRYEYGGKSDYLYLSW